jgi:photosystem II stability/assembly factor-like uncharacterized protein
VYFKHFSDGRGVAVAMDGVLYQIGFNGKAPERFEINLPAGGYVSSAFFSSSRDGWVAVNYFSDPDDDMTAKKAMIFYTNDSGRTWFKQFERIGVEFAGIVFHDGNHGWATGRTAGNGGLYDSKLLLLTTSNSGREWVDVSNIVDRSVESGGRALAVSGASMVLLLTAQDNIYRINDRFGPADFVAIADERVQTYVGQLGISANGELWLLGGTDGREGVWGVLSKWKNGSWHKHVTPNVYFASAIELSENEFFAAGYSSLSETSKVESRIRKGSIYYSSDAGGLATYLPRCAVRTKRFV